MYETSLTSRYFFKRDNSKRDQEIFQQLPLQPKSYVDENLPVLARWQDENPSKIPIYNLYNPGYIKNEKDTLPPIIHLLKRYPKISKRSIPSKESNLESTQSEYIMRNVFDVFDRLKDMKYFNRGKSYQNSCKVLNNDILQKRIQEIRKKQKDPCYLQIWITTMPGKYPR